MNDTRTAPGPIDLRAAFGNAMQHFQAGRLTEAKIACREIIAAAPDHADAIQLFGVIANIAGQSAAAVELIGRAIELKRGNVPAEFHNNMGLALRAAGQLDTAIEHFRRALSLKPDLAEAFANLALIFQEQGKLDDAIDHFNQVTLLLPTNAEAFYYLAGALHQSGRQSDAVACYNKALSLKPNYAEAHNDLGAILRDQGRLDEAAARFERALNLDPSSSNAHYNLGLIWQDQGRTGQALAAFGQAAKLGNLLASHRMSALTGETAEQPPRQFIEALFDGYAPRFERHLVGDLGYEAPQTLRRMVGAQGPGVRYKRALDLGCGTGLSGQAFHDLADRLTGVDLSAQMIKKAAAKNIYARLEVADATAFLERETEKFDLFLAADVLIYMGRLDPLFAAVAARAEPGARFAFTAEISSGPDYLLQPTGHYAHAQAYIETALAQIGGRVLSWETHPIRLHKLSPVEGHHVVAGFDSR